ncbi:hippurate hydrolase [Azoarcus olearius]|uniref:M20 aminoacylase family protein n=1 Tax=Azoarcus sp. (strain BH72) TaxID=418699 RepID=UPI0008061E0A|nr:M20 aminoacylase family protein [Azoarcus olearius]ANQ83296.1 hippurate hydrolase [Azoarcus olearius]
MSAAARPSAGGASSPGEDVAQRQEGSSENIADDALAGLLPALVRLRHDLHAHPELGFAEHRTAAVVAAELRAIGLAVHEGIGGTGVVGVLRRGSSGASVGLRADMDALPMDECSGVAYASTHAGAHHGCGHDGHTSMLLGAARLLAARDFDGTVNFIFQPAEEGLGGARAMVEDGLFERFPCDAVYALHNWPALPLGTAQTRPGPIMAAADRFDIVIRGRGGHAAQPHTTPDAILAAGHLVSQLHAIVSRRIDPVESAVLSITRIEGGHTHNVLPAEVKLTGTVRSFDPAAQDTIEAALHQIADGVALASGTTIAIDYLRYYPATINHAAEAQVALEAAANAGLQVKTAPAPAFTSEDFAFMLQARPGAYLWLGQGRGGDDKPLHHPAYDFNDAALPHGVRWLVAVAERQLQRR